MPLSRRNFLVTALQASVSTLTLLVPRWVLAAERRPAFEANAIDAALQALGLPPPQESTEILFKAPEIAENGAVVPVEVESRLPYTRAMLLLVEKNPHVLSGRFEFPAGTEPFFATRVKMAETSRIHAIALTDKGNFSTTRLVKVTLGGCGG
jgi:sulfur-oxidizing protein SoxY